MWKVKKTQIGQLEIKTTVHYEKYTEINNKLDVAEENIYELEDTTIKTIHYKTPKYKNNFKNEISISDMWENFKQPNTCVIENPERKRGKIKDI